MGVVVVAGAGSLAFLWLIALIRRPFKKLSKIAERKISDFCDEIEDERVQQWLRDEASGKNRERAEMYAQARAMGLPFSKDGRPDWGAYHERLKNGIPPDKRISIGSIK